MTHTSGEPISAEQWAHIGEYLQREAVRLVSPAIQSQLRDEWLDVTRQESQLDDALLIGLVGGTGVGKSTFINALAGEIISRSGDRRPTTDRVVVYRHAATEIPADVPTDDFSQPTVLHQHDELTKVVMFDFPDFDSAERSHAHILKRYLEHLDVLLIVVDDMKYADRRLYELLSTLNHSPDNLFVLLNKIDRLAIRYGDGTEDVIQDLMNDLREKMEDHAQIRLASNQIFPISAGDVLRARIESNDTKYAERFAAVEQVLTSFQEDKRRRRAKELNIDARKGRLVHSLGESALGEENRSILAETRQLITDWDQELEDALRAIPQQVLLERERRSLRKSRMRQAGTNWGFPFGFLFTMMGELPWNRKSEDLMDSQTMAARIHQHYRGFFEAVQNLQARFRTEFVGTGVESTGGDTRQIGGDERWSSVMANQAHASLQDKSQKPNVGQRWLAHTPPIIVVLMAIWSRIYPVLDSLTDDERGGFFSSLIRSILTSLSPTFLIATALMILLAYGTSCLVIWVRQVQQLDARIAEAEEGIRRAAETQRSQALHELKSNVDELAAEMTQLESWLTT